MLAPGLGHKGLYIAGRISGISEEALHNRAVPAANRLERTHRALELGSVHCINSIL